MKEQLGGIVDLLADLERTLAADPKDPPAGDLTVNEIVNALVSSRRALTADEELVSDGLVGAKEAGAFLGISKGSVYNLIRSGELRQVRIAGRTLVAKRQLVALAASHLSSARDSGGDE